MKSKTEKLKGRDHSVTGVAVDISWQTTGTGIPVENVVILYSRRKNNTVQARILLYPTS